jgi:thiamine-monophosphate kinase
VRGQTLGDLGEERLIERLRRRLGPLVPPPPAGIGDDAARISRRGSHDWVWTADLLTEGVHFRRAWTEAHWLGRKALAVNLSDVAAMGAIPRSFLLTLALPPALELAWFDDFARGLRDTALAAGVSCVGGDTTASRSGIFVGITVMGEARHGLLRRDGARPGDGLWVSGPLGASAAGLRLLRAGWRLRRGSAVAPSVGRATRGREAAALRAHLDPRPPLALGPWLARSGISRAAIDLSDGLAADLPRLCLASGVGARVDLAAVPVHPAERRGVRAALQGGEDYALLFTVSKRKEEKLRYLAARIGERPQRIGEVLPPGAGIHGVAAGGASRPLAQGAFEHFPGRGSSR